MAGARRFRGFGGARRVAIASRSCRVRAPSSRARQRSRSRRLAVTSASPAWIVRVSNRAIIDLEPRLATAAFRIFQEALTNAVRHSRATSVSARISAARGRLLMVIVDDGIGLPADAVRSESSLGLLGMHERARSVGGNLRLRPRRVRGTLVSFLLPLTNGHARS